MRKLIGGFVGLAVLVIGLNAQAVCCAGGFWYGPPTTNSFSYWGIDCHCGGGHSTYRFWYDSHWGDLVPIGYGDDINLSTYSSPQTCVLNGAYTGQIIIGKWWYCPGLPDEVCTNGPGTVELEVWSDNNLTLVCPHGSAVTTKYITYTITALALLDCGYEWANAQGQIWHPPMEFDCSYNNPTNFALPICQVTQAYHTHCGGGDSLLAGDESDENNAEKKNNSEATWDFTADVVPVGTLKAKGLQK